MKRELSETPGITEEEGRGTRSLRVPSTIEVKRSPVSWLSAPWPPPATSLATVALTTIAQDAPALAGAALELALTRTEHEDGPAAETILPPRLVIRQTSAAPA
jgi:hypothetical protein